MSRHTLSRIPKDVQHIFKVYEIAAQSYRPYDDKLVSQFLDKTSPYYEMFCRRKLLSDGSEGPIFNRSDFPPVIRDIVSNIFETPLQLENKLDLPAISTASALDSDFASDPLFSDWHHTAKHFSDYQARILSSLASYYTPLSAPKGSSARKSLRWYEKLLANTPVIFFFSQKQRLMSESSLRGINQPLNKFQGRLDQIRQKYNSDPLIARRVRNYHLTDIVTTDIFKLAVEKEQTGRNGTQSSSSTEFSSVATSTGDNAHVRVEDQTEEHSLPETNTDRLCEYLHSLQKPHITGPDGASCSEISIAKSRIASQFPIDTIESALDDLRGIRKLPSIFPYDIHYRDLYMLTIESPIFGDDHSTLLDLLSEQNDFDLFAVRISKAGSLEFGVATEEQNSPQRELSPTYDQLLEWAEKQHQVKPSRHVSQLLERIGESGLVEVEENVCNSAFYVFKETRKE